jgi:hypothetical protein
MKPIPDYPRHPNERNTAALVRSLIVSAIMLVILLSLTGCQVTVTAKPDYNAWLEIVGLTESGEVPPIRIIPAK